MNLLQSLQKRKLIEKEVAAQIEQEARMSGKRVEELLLEKKAIDEPSLFALKAEELGILLKQVEAGEIPLQVLELVPEDSAKFYRMIPLSKTENMLEVGMVYPEDLKAQEALKFLSRQGDFSYQAVLITQSSFENLMKQYRNLRQEVTQALEELEEEIKTKKTQPLAQDVGHIVEEAPVIKMVAVILRTAVEGGASDIHIEPTRKNLRVRYRLLGELHPSLILPLRVHPAIIARIKILSNMKIDETRIPQDGRFSTVVDGKSFDFRVSTFPTSLGEKVALRVLDPEGGIKSFEALGLEGDNLVKFKDALRKPFGLILVTGPTGSGKSTTLATALNSLNKEGTNVVSLEDPVEYMIEGVNQSQVKPEIGYDFAQGLREILRQDPDIIMVGEVRDKETASLAVHAALTGHIVLSTLHTNNAVGVIPRLLDMGIERYLLPSALNLALAQRLVRHLCDNCKEKTVLRKELKVLFAQIVEQAPPVFQEKIASFLSKGNAQEISVYKPVGCKKCAKTGYMGRIGIFEVIAMTDELTAITMGELSDAALEQEMKRQGMVTMAQDGILKVLDGITTIEEVLRVTGHGGSEERGGK
ncbi:MAG: GspE/PulE family protein [bacterium]|nr:GspE/PulE family protein [bacterium]